ncbi:hypothetical protein FACS1894139_10360 [Planctomycetales bacterium]|nr:hypothetical protein FACS1894108_04880 [Planctomycetales bacterium]GHT05824.1 hypothetical protein FACS1894139_10360 [Planctomycetales bacterium]
MSHELFYTSAPSGLQPGSRGFCTVAATRGMSKMLLEKLEALSGYRVVNPQDAAQNPVAFNHYQITAGGAPYHVLSRIAFAGFDYSQRTNKLAHHLALKTNELPLGGPAVVLSGKGVMAKEWQGEPRLIDAPRPLPAGEMPLAVCQRWQKYGDAGWAGVVAQALLTGKPVVSLFNVGQAMLPLVAEVFSLLTPPQRWQFSFSTYLADLPAGVKCDWKCCLVGSPLGEKERKNPANLVLDLTKPLGDAEALTAAVGAGELVKTARTGACAAPKTAVKNAAPTPPPTKTGIKPAAKKARNNDDDDLVVLERSWDGTELSDEEVAPRERANRRQTREPARVESSFGKWIIAALFLLLIGGGTYVWHYYKERAEAERKAPEEAERAETERKPEEAERAETERKPEEAERAETERKPEEAERAEAERKAQEEADATKKKEDAERAEAERKAPEEADATKNKEDAERAETERKAPEEADATKNKEDAERAETEQKSQEAAKAAKEKEAERKAQELKTSAESEIPDLNDLKLGKGNNTPKPESSLALTGGVTLQLEGGNSPITVTGDKGDDDSQKKIIFLRDGKPIDGHYFSITPKEELTEKMVKVVAAQRGIYLAKLIRDGNFLLVEDKERQWGAELKIKITGKTKRGAGIFADSPLCDKLKQATNDWNKKLQEARKKLQEARDKKPADTNEFPFAEAIKKLEEEKKSLTTEGDILEKESDSDDKEKKNAAERKKKAITDAIASADKLIELCSKLKILDEHPLFVEVEEKKEGGARAGKTEKYVLVLRLALTVKLPVEK